MTEKKSLVLRSVSELPKTLEHSDEDSNAGSFLGKDHLSAPPSPRGVPEPSGRANRSSSYLYVYYSSEEEGVETGSALLSTSVSEEKPTAKFQFKSISQDIRNGYTAEELLVRSVTPDISDLLMSQNQFGMEDAFADLDQSKPRSSSVMLSSGRQTPLGSEDLRLSGSDGRRSTQFRTESPSPVGVKPPSPDGPKLDDEVSSKKSGWFGKKDKSKRDSTSGYKWRISSLVRAISPDSKKKDEKKNEESVHRKKKDDVIFKKGRIIQKTSLRGQMLNISCYADLPKELRKMVKEAKISPEEADKFVQSHVSL